LPLTEVTSRYFWITEPKEFHSFDATRAIIDNDGIVFDEHEEVEEEDEESEDQELATPMTDEEFRMNTLRNVYNRKRLEVPIERKRQDAHTILMKIIRGDVSDEYSLKHTLKIRKELLQYLSLDENGQIPKGFSIDHIKERSTCVTDDDFETINYFTNLRLYPAADNLARNWN
jgi:hypothetical protein